MGRRSGGSNKSKPGNKKQGTEPNSSANTHNDSTEEDLLDSLMFKQMPPNKRNELNLIVKKLLNLSSNFVADEPTSAAKLRQELDEIFDLVTKIIALEEQFNMSRKLRSSRKPYLKTLIDWLESHGAKLDGVDPEDYGHNAGFGLRATKDLSKGDLVISIPRRCFMSTETARDSTISALIEKDPMLKSMPNVALALHLLIEKNSPASFWEPYINVLPNYYSTVLYFSPADFDELKGSPAYEDALRQFKYVARQYAYFYGKFQTTMLRDYFTFEDYRWAVSTVMTRQNQVPCKEDINKTTNTLIPFWDLANHECRSDSEISTDFDELLDGTICMASRSFIKGEQFTIYYGNRSTADFLVHNGFVDSTAGTDEADDEQKDKSLHRNSMALRLGISRNDPLAQKKYEILDQLSIPRTRGHFTLTNEEKPFDNVLLAFLRVISMTKDDIDNLSNDIDHSSAKKVMDDTDKDNTETNLEGTQIEYVDKVRELLNDTQTLNPNLDEKVRKYLETRCTLLLRSYPTTLEKDLELLQLEDNTAQKSNLSGLNQKHCTILRSQEKQILEHVIKYCQNVPT